MATNLAVTLFVAAQVSSFAIWGSVVASGGTPSGNAAHQVVGTAGQPAIGIGSAARTAVCNGFWCFSDSQAAYVPEPRLLPQMFAFTLVSSNPIRGQAEFELALPRASRMTLRVFDVSGRQIGDPVERRFEAGRHRLTWGTDLRSSGVYFVRLRSDTGFEAKRKIVVVR